MILVNMPPIKIRKPSYSTSSYGIDVSDQKNPRYVRNKEWWESEEETVKDSNSTHLEDFNELLALAVTDSTASNQTSK